MSSARKSPLVLSSGEQPIIDNFLLRRLPSPLLRYLTALWLPSLVWSVLWYAQHEGSRGDPDGQWSYFPGCVSYAWLSTAAPSLAAWFCFERLWRRLPRSTLGTATVLVLAAAAGAIAYGVALLLLRDPARADDTTHSAGPSMLAGTLVGATNQCFFRLFPGGACGPYVRRAAGALLSMAMGLLCTVTALAALASLFFYGVMGLGLLFRK